VIDVKNTKQEPSDKELEIYIEGFVAGLRLSRELFIKKSLNKKF
jgi:hypothetical protein